LQNELADLHARMFTKFTKIMKRPEDLKRGYVYKSTFGKAEEEIEYMKQDFTLKPTLGESNVVPVSAGKFDSDFATKMEGWRREIRMVFNMPKTTYDPTAGTKAASQATAFFENKITMYMNKIAMVARVLSEMLGLPDIDMSSITPFVSRDGDAETRKAKQEAEVIRVQLINEELKLKKFTIEKELVTAMAQQRQLPVSKKDVEGAKRLAERQNFTPVDPSKVISKKEFDNNEYDHDPEKFIKDGPFTKKSKRGAVSS
jgi:hypothetical protein